MDVQIRIAHLERNKRRDSEHRVNGRRACATALDRLLYFKARSDRTSRLTKALALDCAQYGIRA